MGKRSANGCVEFIKQAVTVLPRGIGLDCTADAGFFEKRFWSTREPRVPYIIVLVTRCTKLVFIDTVHALHDRVQI